MHDNRSRLLLGLVAAVCWAGAAGAAVQEGPCAERGHRQFDFWLGEWEVTGPEGRVAGRNRITSEEQGCLLLEQWQGATGGTGTSMNYYDPAADGWRQLWVSPEVVIDIVGGMVDGSMVLEGTIVYLKDGRRRPFRGIWTPLPDGGLRQFFEEGGDGGGWSPWFEGFYRRIEPR